MHCGYHIPQDPEVPKLHFVLRWGASALCASPTLGLQSRRRGRNVWPSEATQRRVCVLYCYLLQGLPLGLPVTPVFKGLKSIFKFQTSVRFPTLIHKLGCASMTACVYVCCWQNTAWVLFERQHQFSGRLLFCQRPGG